ncbi:MAG TPA: hypothetical protein PKU97_13285, partial [Kofleriaceae bacterium]|nr:hypothetical protein [Kofleriaceae bacterium]
LSSVAPAVSFLFPSPTITLEAARQAGVVCAGPVVASRVAVPLALTAAHSNRSSVGPWPWRSTVI